MASDNTPKTKATDKKLAMQKAEEVMQSHIGKQLVKEKWESLKLQAQVEKQKEEIEELKTTPRGRSRPKKIVSPVSQLTEIAILKSKLQQSQDESSNLEIALKKCILSKAELNNQIEQLIDDVRKYEELYARAKGVAQALGKAVSILTSEIQNG